jgi:hypothetical protein
MCSAAGHDGGGARWASHTIGHLNDEGTAVNAPCIFAELREADDGVWTGSLVPTILSQAAKPESAIHFSTSERYASTSVPLQRRVSLCFLCGTRGDTLSW